MSSVFKFFNEKAAAVALSAAAMFTAGCETMPTMSQGQAWRLGSGMGYLLTDGMRPGERRVSADLLGTMLEIGASNNGGCIRGYNENNRTVRENGRIVYRGGVTNEGRDCQRLEPYPR